MPKVLVVDDHAVMRRGVRNILKTRLGWECCGEAESGEAALAAVENCGAEIVLMDVTMPGMGGIAATKVLHDALPEVKVVLFTFHSSAEFLRAGFLAGAIGYALKSDSENELVMALQLAQANSTYITPAIDSAVAAGVISELHQHWRVQMRRAGSILH